MEAYVIDTVGIVRRLEKRIIGQKAKKVIEKAEEGQAEIFIPSMVFAEIMYNCEKAKIAISLADVDTYMKMFLNIKEYPITFAVIQETIQINDIPELHDRIIAGTAKYLNLPLITSDRKIASSKWVKTIW